MSFYPEDQEDHRKARLDMHILRGLLPYFRPHVISLSICAVLLGLFSLLSLAGPLLVRHAIDVNFAEKDFRGLTATASIYLSVLILSFIINYLQQVKLEKTGQKIVRKIRITIFGHLTRLPQSFFDGNPVGKLLSRVESDTEALRTMFTYTVVTILSDFLMMLGMFIVMFALSPRLALVLLALAPMVILTVSYFNGRIVPIFIEVRRRTADVYAFLEEYIRGARIVQAFNQEENICRKMNDVNKAKVDVEYPGERLSNYFGHSVFLLSTIATSLILGLGGYWVLKSPTQLTIGTLVAFLGYIQRFFGPIFHLSEQINIIQKAFSGAKRIDDILQMDTQDALTASSESEPPLIISGISDRNGIVFENVWFAYKNEDWILKDVSFQVKPGQRVAVVGPTGAGKTTIISLLYRFYHPQKGRILLDGMDIRSMPLQELRRRLGLVMQDIILFPGTLLDNLRLDNPEISEQDVSVALETVHAAYIAQRRQKGIHVELSEQGSNLSMGERQLMSFARALVHRPDYLVLDEATSSIDPLTEQKIQQALNNILMDRTALIVAHRLQTIVDSDGIIVMKNGKVIAQGTHSELLEGSELYRHLYHIQLGTGKVAS